MWTFKRVLLEDMFKEDLNETNHIQMKMHDLKMLSEIYGFEKIAKGKTKETASQTIEGWDSETKHPQIGQIIIHENGEKKYWEPFIEYTIRKHLLEGKKVAKYKSYYMDGTVNELGVSKESTAFRGYRCFHEYILE